MCDWTLATKQIGDDRVAHLYIDEGPYDGIRGLDA